MPKAALLMAIMAFAVMTISAAEKEDAGDVSDVHFTTYL